ncbi:MAG: LysR family transcriptional regulator [Lachnospiraceae bacterium]|nr:LysR family transcriptional regulator [Lachnospiraceae bacterium]
MTTKDMQYVLMIAKYGNMTKAAETLYISQPALSIQLNRLEEELGLKLFERSSKGMKLTYAGEEFVVRAQKISVMHYELQDRLNNIRENVDKQLRVGYTLKHLPSLFPDTLLQFKSLYPHVQVVSVDGHISELEEKLLSGELDIIITNPTTRKSRFHYIKICDDHLLAVLNQDHPACRNAVFQEGSPYPWLDLKEVETERFILQDSDQLIRQFEEEAILFADVHPKHTYKIGSIEAGCRLAVAGYGVSFTYQNRLSQLDHAAYFLVGDPNLSVPLYAYMLKENTENSLLMDWIRITRQRQRDLISGQ